MILISYKYSDACISWCCNAATVRGRLPASLSHSRSLPVGHSFLQIHNLLSLVTCLDFSGDRFITCFVLQKNKPTCSKYSPVIMTLLPPARWCQHSALFCTCSGKKPFPHGYGSGGKKVDIRIKLQLLVQATDKQVFVGKVWRFLAEELSKDRATTCDLQASLLLMAHFLSPCPHEMSLKTKDDTLMFPGSGQVTGRAHTVE